MGYFCPIGPVPSPRTAPPIVSKCWAATPECDGGLVEICQAPFRVGCVEGRRYRLENPSIMTVVHKLNAFAALTNRPTALTRS